MSCYAARQRNTHTDRGQNMTGQHLTTSDDFIKSEFVDLQLSVMLMGVL